MPGEVNNKPTGDAYTDAATARGPRSVRVRLTVRNAAVYLQYGYGGRAGTTNFDSPERFMLPGTYSLDETERPPDGARCRSAVPGTPAQVSIDLVPS